MNSIQKQALFNSGLTALYIVAVSVFMFYLPHALAPKQDNVLMPIVFLLVFVLSASVTSFLMFGRPVLMYLDGKKKEALELLTYTLVSFAAITFVALILVITLGH